jgi:hypothetical protein
MVYSGLQTLQTSARLEEQRREIERRIDQLFREGKAEEYARAKAMLEEERTSELARYFLIQDVKKAALIGGAVLGGWFVYRKVLT